MAAPVISSRDNAIIKMVRSLRLRVHREAERAFVVEGWRAVGDGIAAGGSVRYLIVRDGEGVPQAFQDLDRIRFVDAKLFAFVSDTSTPQGILAVFETPSLQIPDGPLPLYLILDAISDPGNLGTIIRTGAAAGVNALFLGHDCVDWLNAKVVRAAMGAHFRIAIRAFDEAAQELIAARCSVRVSSDAQGAQTHDEIDWTPGAALIIGSEAHGVSAPFRAFATTSASIPMASGVESVNAGIAAGVMLFEAQRQRRRAARPA